MQSQGSKIIRAYSAPLDEISKEETRISLKNESVKIAVCTEALGIGVDIRTITRIPDGVNFGIRISKGLDKSGAGISEFQTALILEIPQIFLRKLAGRAICQFYRCV